MSSSLIRTQLEKSLKASSLMDLVRQRQGGSTVLLLDMSGSMGDYMRNGKMKVEGLRETVESIQAETKPPMIAFDGREGCRVVTHVPEPAGSTPLHSAIEFARTRGTYERAIVISDGEPDNRPAALDAARSWGKQIDVIYVGDPGDAGERFLLELAKLTGGTRFTGDLSDPKQIADTIMGFLEAGADSSDDDED